MAGRFTKTGPRARHFIREWRKHRNLTLEQLAERIGISSANLSRLENGKQDYSQSLLEVLADALNCEPPDLLIRNPLDRDAPWSLMDSLKNLKPETQKRALRLIEVLRAEDDEAA